MRFILSIFLLLPFVGSSAVVCSIEQQVNGQVSIICRDDESSDSTTNYFSEAACDNLKAFLESRLNDCLLRVQDIEDAKEQSQFFISQAYNDINSFRQELPRYQEQLDSGLYSQLQSFVVSLLDRLDTISSIVNTMPVQDAIDTIQESLEKVAAYDCSANSNLVCNSQGGGNFVCPCQDQFREVINAINQTKDELHEQRLTVLEINLKTEVIKNNVSNLVSRVTEIRDRLNAPDDRIWEELQGMYSNLYSNMMNTVTNSLQFYELFGDLQKLMDSELEENNLKLSTEGVIALNNTVANMANLINNQFQGRLLYEAFQSYTNQVLKYYNDYSWLTGKGSSKTLPYVPSNYNPIYDAFTNDTYSAGSRYRRLGNVNLGNVTNWFQRIELYLQGLNGWFESAVEDGALAKNKEETEDSIQSGLDATTNSFGTVVVALSNAYDNVTGFSTRLFDGLHTIEFHAELPSVITFFPEVEVFEGTSFGPVTLETSEIVEYLEVARNVTSMFWRVSIWVLYFLLAASAVRLVFLVVAYIISIAKDL